MLAEDIQLANYLLEKESPQIFFCQDRTSEKWVEYLPQKRSVFYLTDRNWLEPQIWEDLEFKKTVSGKIAVFFGSEERVPFSCFTFFESLGFDELLFKNSGLWQKISLKNSSKEIRRSFQLRNLLIDVFSKKIPTRSKKVIHAGGHCYHFSNAGLPFGDTIERINSKLLVFEDYVRLTEDHRSHAEIKEHGKGRLSHWEHDLFFSSLDQTDPKINGKRYRYVHLRRPFHFLRPYFEVKKDNITSAEEDHFLKSLLQKVHSKTPMGLEAMGEKTEGVCLFTCNLSSGGAEKQLCYLARALKEQGEKVSVLLFSDMSPSDLHHAPLLREVGIEPHSVMTYPFKWDYKRIFAEKELRIHFDSLNEYLHPHVWTTYQYLMETKPSVLHCWLDRPNIYGAIAGLLAGVPKIILSTRSLSPEHFPRFNSWWFRHWYQAVVQSPRVQLVGNSEAGIRSYAEWIGISPDRFQLNRNGIDLKAIQKPAVSTLDAFRKEQNLKPDTPVIAGVFRLDSEKRPLLFLKIVDQLRQKFPSLRVFMAGGGLMQADVENEINQLKLNQTVTLLGKRKDIPVIMEASDLVLLTSNVEGTPNVLIEAQWLNRPVVCTPAGGSEEALQDGVTGFLCPTEQDVVARCSQLLENSSLRKKMGDSGPSFVLERFSLKKMTESAMKVYR